MSGKISVAFKKNFIQLTKKIELSSELTMPDGRTNKFFEVQDTDENKYLIRQNGRLWQPFTREAEDFNLKELQSKQIDTNVLENDVDNGFQICKLYAKELSMSHWGEQLDSLGLVRK